MVKCSQSMKEIESFDVVEVVVGSSLEFVLTRCRSVEDEPFCPFFVVTMICEFQQSEGIKVHKSPPESPEERQVDPMEDAPME